MSVPLPEGDRWFRGLSTQRLAIGRLVPDDADTLASYRSDHDVAIFQDWQTPFTTERADAFIAAMTAVAPLTPGEWFQFAVRRSDKPELVGDVAIHRHGDDPAHLTVGYTLAREHWGRGFATEAVGCVIEYATEATGATRVTAEAIAANGPSLRVLERLGFVEVNRAERVEKIDGVWHDEVVYQRDVAPPAVGIGAVLVGGASSRMGSPKPLVEVGAATMFEHVANALEVAGLEVVVVGDGAVPEHNHTTIPDPDGLEGPVAGISAALAIAEDRPVFVVATDQPYLAPTTVRRLHSFDGAQVAPLDHDRVQVTCAVYRRGFRDLLEPVIAADRAPSIQRLSHETGVLVYPPTWEKWGEDGRSWRSLDTPTAVAEAAAQFGLP